MPTTLGGVAVGLITLTFPSSNGFECFSDGDNVASNQTTIEGSWTVVVLLFLQIA